MPPPLTLLQRYSAWLIRSPYRANMLSMGGIMFVGDAVAQLGIEGKREFDTVRSSVMVSWCACFYSPFFVKYWGFLNRVWSQPVSQQSRSRGSKRDVLFEIGRCAVKIESKSASQPGSGLELG